MNSTSYAQYMGGIGNGFSLEAACTTDLNGTSTALTIGTINGPTTFCNNASDTYSIAITTGIADSYHWTGPTGTTIVSQQIDGYAQLLFGNTSGNVTVEVSNACATASTNIAVTNSSCNQFFGGNNDGHDHDASCSTTLDGVGTGLTIGTIIGPTTFCDNNSETFSVLVTAGNADNFSWTGPTGTTVTSQQVDGYAQLRFGNNSGNVSVEVSNACATASANIAVTNSSCNQFFGGNNDGHDHDASCSTTLDGVGTGLTIGTITGPTTFCDNNSETFNVLVTAGNADNFSWTGPTGTTVASQQVDGYAQLRFGNTSGNVTVEASNSCAIVSTSLAVSNSICNQFFGGNNDGHDHDASCSTTLDGVGTGLTIGSISGPTAFCDNGSETYSVNITTGSADNFSWTGPSGTTVASQQVDGYAQLRFGNTPGNVSVIVSNACASSSTNLAVSNIACERFFGGNGDGFALSSSAMSIPLPVELVSFLATIENKTVRLNWSTASETNNDYFIVERSRDLVIWENVKKIAGSGNSNDYTAYESFDDNPFSGFSYYRLKQVDFDGSTFYSDVISINIDGHTLSIYPNPTQSKIYIQLSSIQPTVLSLTNLSGAIVSQIKDANTESIIMDVSNMKTGIYFLVIQNPSSIETRKVEIIQ